MVLSVFLRLRRSMSFAVAVGRQRDRKTGMTKATLWKDWVTGSSAEVEQEKIAPQEAWSTANPDP